MTSGARAYVVTLTVLGVTQGASYVFIRVAVEELSPAFLMEVRLLLAAIPLLAWFVVTGRWRELVAAWRLALVLGVLNAAGPYLLIAWGESHVDSGVAAVAAAAVPIFVALLAIRMLPEERVGGVRLVGVVLGLVGVGVLCGVDLSGGSIALVATLAIVLAAALVAAAQLFIQQNLAFGGAVMATVGMTTGAVLLLPFAVLTRPTEAPSADVVWSTVALGLMSTLFAQLVFFWMLAEYGASRASLVTYTTPVFALILGAWFLDEPLTLAKLGGLLLIVGGVALGSGLAIVPSRRSILGRLRPASSDAPP